MKHTMDLSKIFSLLFLLAMSSQLHADETAAWSSGAGTTWKSGSGECWQSAFPGTDNCADEPAPEMMETDTGKYWADDGDYDGVVDSRDTCPFTPEGVAVDSKGCALDEDNDGVPDYLDDCLGTPANTQVNVNGCPVLLINLDNITFTTNSASLTDADKRILDDVIPLIKESNNGRIDIVGHTDSRGAESYNKALSERRAKTVLNYLISNGVAGGRLFAYGSGESEPVASNDTAAGRQQNRRVEILAK